MKSELNLHSLEDLIIAKCIKALVHGDLSLILNTINQLDKNLVTKYKKYIPILSEKRTCGARIYSLPLELRKKAYPDREQWKQRSIKEILSLINPSSKLLSLTNDDLVNLSKYYLGIKFILMQKTGGENKCNDPLNLALECKCSVVEVDQPVTSLTTIGLGITPTFIPPRINCHEVIIDKHTTLNQKVDKSILYTSGWSLDGTFSSDK